MITKKELPSKPGKLNKTDSKKLLKSLLLALTGATVAWLGQNWAQIDYGQYTEIVYVAMPVFLNAMRKLLAGFDNKLLQKILN